MAGWEINQPVSKLKCRLTGAANLPTTPKRMLFLWQPNLTKFWWCFLPNCHNRRRLAQPCQLSTENCSIG